MPAQSALKGHAPPRNDGSPKQVQDGSGSSCKAPLDLKHGTNAAHVADCACKECREPQRIRMARNR